MGSFRLQPRIPRGLTLANFFSLLARILRALLRVTRGRWASATTAFTYHFELQDRWMFHARHRQAGPKG